MMLFRATVPPAFLLTCAGAALLACTPSSTSLSPDAANDVGQGDGGNDAIPQDAASPASDVAAPGTATDGGASGTDTGANTVDAGGAPLACQDDDPLLQSDWVGFCGDRVDDNCQVDAPSTPCPDGPSSHNYCQTGDEPCPATQPASAAPEWDCNGTPPTNVIAYAAYDDSSNPNVTSFCAFVYESVAIAGEHYVAVDVTNGTNVRAAQPGTPNRDCMADTFARRHFYLSDLDDGNCPDVKYIHAYPNPSTGYQGYPVDEQKLSNRCRKMIRNIGYNDPAFNPDIQYFAASRDEALAKLAILDSAEVNCIGIDNLQNQPYRPTEQFYVQASAPLVLVQP